MTGNKFHPPQIFAFYIPDAAPANPRTKRMWNYISVSCIVRHGSSSSSPSSSSSSLSRPWVAFVTTLHILIPKNQADTHKYSLMVFYLWKSLCFSDSAYLYFLSLSLSPLILLPKNSTWWRTRIRWLESVNEKVGVVTWVFGKWQRESFQPDLRKRVIEFGPCDKWFI